MKVSIANSAGVSFCWNYATGTFYSNPTGDLSRFWGSIVIMQVVLSVAIIQVTVFVAIMELEVSVALMQFL